MTSGAGEPAARRPPPAALPAALLERARRLAVPGERRILGIAGPPGAGKSTLAAALVAGLEPLAALVPMDGFHLARAELARLGRAGRKGAPDTFDAAGFVALLARLRERGDGIVYAPAFRRDLEEPIAGAIPVDAAVALVVTEGNYLLHHGDGFAPVRRLLDEAWYLRAGEEERTRRLIARRMSYGASRAEALAWATGSDRRNADLVARGIGRADLVLTQGLRPWPAAATRLPLRSPPGSVAGSSGTS